MRLDARIAVRLLVSGETPDASPGSVLVRIGADTGRTVPGVVPGVVPEVAPRVAPGRAVEAVDEISADQGAGGWAAVLALPGNAVVSHEAACRCCSGRTGFSDALGLLFARRARMELPFFTRVVVQAAPEQLHDLVTILCQDDTVASRFRRES